MATGSDDAAGPPPHPVGSWLPPDDEHEQASELAARGPEAFPD